jgi:hypothetical protein
MAHNPSTDEWEVIGAAVSGTTPITGVTSDDIDLYYWSVRAMVPEEYWIPGLVGHRTRVKSNDGSRDMMSFGSDWTGCAEQVGWNSFEVYRRCSADSSREVWLSTEDFCDTSGCVRPNQ